MSTSCPRKHSHTATLLVIVLVTAGTVGYFMLVKNPTRAEPASQEDVSNKGIFVLTQFNQFFDSNGKWRGDEINKKYLDDLLDRPYVSGLTYWVGWAALEPNQGNYRWEIVDRVVEEVEKRGKKINLGILPGFAPDWIKNHPQIEKFSFQQSLQGWDTVVTETEPFPLDPIYLEQYYTLISALASHVPDGKSYQLKNAPALHYIAIGGPSNGVGLETFIKSDNADGEYVKQRVKELTGADSFEAGYAQVWQESTRKFATFFPNKHLALALSVGITSGKSEPKLYRTSKPARWIYYYLRSQEYKENYGVPVHLMTLSLTGKDWMQPGEGNPAQEVIGLVVDSNAYGLTTGYQMIGIAWASQDKEERARPFAIALEKGVNFGASWLEIWPEDLMKNRLHLPTIRGWVDQIHPCTIENVCPGNFEEIIESPVIQAAQQMRRNPSGDANGDGVVDGTDLELLKEDYLGEPAHNTDFNSDGRVDSEDFAILQSNYKENR